MSYFDIVEAIEKIDSQDIDESVNSVEKIVKKETPANTETPAHSETPVNTETPVNIETPVNTETPVEAVSKCSTLPSGRDKISQEYVVLMLYVKLNVVSRSSKLDYAVKRMNCQNLVIQVGLN